MKRANFLLTSICVAMAAVAAPDDQKPRGASHDSKGASSAARVGQELRAPSSQPLPVLVDATAFMTRVSMDKALSATREALLPKAASAESLHQALTELGPTRVHGRLSQVVDLSNPRKIIIGANAPFVRGVSGGAGAPRSTHVEYEDTGLLMRLSGRAGRVPDDPIHVDCEVEMSAVYSSSVDIGNGIKAPVFSKATHSYQGPVRDGVPVLTIWLHDDNAGDGACALSVVRMVVQAAR